MSAPDMDSSVFDMARVTSIQRNCRSNFIHDKSMTKRPEDASPGLLFHLSNYFELMLPFVKA